MKVSLQQVLKAYLAVRNVEKEKGASNKWAYGIARNKAKMQADIDGIAASEQVVSAAEKTRTDYLVEHAQKDKDGKPVIENNQYVGIDTNTQEFKDILAKCDAEIKKHNDLLKTEAEIDFYMIAFADVPALSPADYEALAVMIKEPEDKK